VPERNTLSEATIAVAWNVQGDVRAVGDITLPAKPNTVTGTAFWLGPRSWLVFAPIDANAVLEAGGAAFDLSASRVAYRLSGPDASTILAKHCPLDFDGSVFAPGTCAQSLFGQVNALYYRHAATEAFTVFVARSFAHDVAHHLRASAAQYGCEAIALRPFVAD
jgi:sarcosine oxidase subunit gamma